MEEIREKSRPRACDRYLVILLRNPSLFLSLSLYPFVDLFLIYLALSLFPEASGEGNNRCVGPHARVRVLARALLAVLASAQVQYPWMSVDLVTHIIVKRGLNSNPSRAAGRAYRTISRCPIPLFLWKRSLLGTDPSGNFLVLVFVQRDTNVVDEAGKQSDASVGNGISGLTRSRGILGEGAPYRRSLSFSSPLIPVGFIGLSWSRGLGSLPPFLSLARKQAVTVREALKEGREKGRFFPRRPGITTKKDAIFEAKSGERSDRGETFLDSSLRAVVKRFSLFLILSRY